MRNRSCAALAAAITTLTLLLGGLTAAPALQAADQPPAAGKISKKVMKPLKAGLDLANQGKYPEAEAELRTAAAIEDKTAFEQFQVDELLGFVALKQAKYKDAAQLYERGLDSGFLPAEQVNDRLRLLAQLYFQPDLRDLNKVVSYGNRWLEASGKRDPIMLGLVGQASYFKDDFSTAANFMKEAVTGAVAAGQKPEENWLLILQNSCGKLRNDPGVIDATVELVRYFPRKEHWINLSASLLRQASNKELEILQVFRLLSAVDAMDSADDFTEAANVALRSGSPGEALKFMERGYALKILDTSGDKQKSQQILDDAKRQAGDDRKALPQFEKEALAAKLGEADVKLGEAFLSYDQPAKALEAIQRGIKKGGVKSLDDANLSLGRAFLATGNRAEAATAFGQVKKPDYSLLVRLWSIYAAQQP
jgi:tetratricopeptide (TPR) repeat protein